MASSLDPAHPEGYNQAPQHRSSSSSINFSLYTPDSPTAVYEFEQIARTFPLPLDKGRTTPIRTERDRDIDPLDFPVEIAVAGEEEDLAPEVDSNWGDSCRGSGSWMNKGLTAWRSQCHRDANMSATSLPATANISPIGAPFKRNLSVISLPASVPELTNSTATSASFALSPTRDHAFLGMRQDYQIESKRTHNPILAPSDGRANESSEEGESSYVEIQGKNPRQIDNFLLT